jgi:hypothetical protein
MKPRLSVIVACIAATSLLSACNRPSASMGVGATPTQASVSPTQAADTPKAIVGIVAETDCFSGPGTSYDPVGTLAPGNYYQVVGIDNDAPWIDDDVTWFQIDPVAIIDPDPPHAPVNELSPQPDPPGVVRSLHCWVPSSGVDLSGDLSGVPGIEMPVVELLGSAPCYHWPAEGSEVAQFLDAGAFFRVVAVDDDATWVDDDIGWLQIDPTAIADPDPPPTSQPAGESSGQPEMQPRCWVPGTSVGLSGDLSQVPVLPISTVLASAEGVSVEPYTSPVEVEAVCSVILADQAAVRVSRTPAVPDGPTVTVDGEHFGLCHAPGAGVMECLPLPGDAGSAHTVRTCYPGEACEDWTVSIPACPEPSVSEVLPVCSLVFEGHPAVQVRGAPASLAEVRVTTDGESFAICHAPDAGVKECVPLPGEVGTTTTVRTCITGEACESWPLTVPDCSPVAEVEVVPICDSGYAAVRVAFTPITLDPPRVTAAGGTFAICHTPERGVLQCLELPGEVGSTTTVRTCFASGACDDWPIMVLDCEEELLSEGKFSLAGVGCHDEKRIFFILDTRLPWLVPGAAFSYTASDGPTGYSCSVHPTIASRLYCSGTRPGTPGGLEVCIQQEGAPSPICHSFADWPAQEDAIPSCVPPTSLPPCSSYGPNNCPSDRCVPKGPNCVPK